MFHFASTGEPPTVDLSMASEDGQSFRTLADDANETQQKANRHMSSISTQEADSGYEASPSSTNDNCTFSFDGRQGSSNETSDIVTCDNEDAVTLEDEDAFESISSTILIDNEEESEMDDEDIVADDFEERMLMGRWSRDLHFSGSPSADLEERCRPSSLPIPIPLGYDSASSRNRTSYSRNNRNLQRLHSHSLPVDVPQSPTSSTTDLSPLSARLAMTLPLSWPTTTFRTMLRTAAGPVSLRLSFQTNQEASGTNRTMVPRSFIPRTRSRRRVIDSDASSFSSSEGDFLEEVFDDVESPSADGLVPLVSSAPSTNGHLLFLPDVVPQSSASGSINVNGVRRSRSISVNLPIEDAVVEVGRTLRRLSDQFNDQLQMRRNRRYTIGEIIRFNANNVREARDFDDYFDSVQKFRQS